MQKTTYRDGHENPWRNGTLQLPPNQKTGRPPTAAVLEECQRLDIGRIVNKYPFLRKSTGEYFGPDCVLTKFAEILNMYAKRSAVINLVLRENATKSVQGIRANTFWKVIQAAVATNEEGTINEFGLYITLRFFEMMFEDYNKYKDRKGVQTISNILAQFVAVNKTDAAMVEFSRFFKEITVEFNYDPKLAVANTVIWAD